MRKRKDVSSGQHEWVVLVIALILRRIYVETALEKLTDMLDCILQSGTDSPGNYGFDGKKVVGGERSWRM